MAGQKELHRLRNRELQIQSPAVAQHHQEETQASARGAHGDGSIFTPVGLGTFARSEVELEKRLGVMRPNALHVIFDDGEAAGVACLAQSLEDLLRAIRVGIEPAHNLPLVRIELAHARHTRARVELLHAGPLGYRARIQCERTRGLCHGEPLATQVVADLAEGLIVEHGDASSDRVVEPGSPGRRSVSVRAHAVAFLEVQAPGRAVPDRR